MISADPTPADVDGSSPVAKWFLEYHNIVRAQYGAAALTWDAGLAAKSQSWATACAFKHQ
jgi:uncharacterized protein YkwD